MRLKRQARELWPYLQEYVQKSVARSGGSAGGGVGVHALSSGLHTGTLLDAQAPQFLKRDGSRSLTGNLSVGAGVTIDGVDISAFKSAYDAHLAPDTHHDPVTAADASITVSTQAINVNLAHNFTWTGAHQFNSDPQINANLDFLGTRSITSNGSNHLTLAPGGDLVLNSTKTWRSNDYSDGIPITGFSNHINGTGNRQLSIHSIKADELHVRLFVADTVRVDVGEEYWGKSMGIVYEDFETPSAIDGTVTVKFEDSAAFSGALFSNNDWLLIRIIDDFGGGLVVDEIWGQVSSYSDLGDDGDGQGHQSWTFTLREGPTEQLVKAGNVAVDFGASGQGYVHLSTLDSADGPWIQIGDWTGANPYTGGNRNQRTVMGKLDSVSDPDGEMSPTGWGFFSDNVYLRGELRTSESAVDDDGFSTQWTEDSLTAPDPDVAAVRWWEDINSRTGDPVAQINAWTDITTNPTDYDHLWLRIEERATSTAAILTLQAIDGEGGGASILVDSRDTIGIHSDDVFVNGSAFRAQVDSTTDLGTASIAWKTLYVDQIIATTISGATLDGQEWQYSGSMVVDANSASNTTVSITNQNTGTASLSVEGNIALGGTVDGVDLASFKSAYDVHIAAADAHHDPVSAGDGIGLSGQQVSVNSTVVRVVRTLTAGDGLSGGGDLSANRSFAVDSSVVRTSRSLTAGNGLTGGGDLSADRAFTVGAGIGITVSASNVAVDQAHAFAWTAQHSFSPGSVQPPFTLGANAQNQTVVGLSADSLNKSVVAGNGLTGGGALSTNVTLDVGAGIGVTVAANSVSVNESYEFDWTGQHGFSPETALPPFTLGANAQGQTVVGLKADQLNKSVTAGNGLTGGGALTANIAVAVGAGNGITVNADNLAVNQAYAFTWIGQHTYSPSSAQAPFVLSANAQGQTVVGFQADQLNKTLTAGNGLTGGGDWTANRTVTLGTPSTLTASTTNNVTSTSHTHTVTTTADGATNHNTILQSDAGGGLILDSLDVDLIESSTTLAINPAGDLVLDPDGDDILPGGNIAKDLGDYDRKYRTLFAAELYVETLVAQDVLATIGGRIMVAPTTKLIANVSGGASTIDVEHNNLASGDYVYLATAPGGIAQVEVMKVTSGASSITGGYRYSVNRNQDGSGTNTWVAGDAVANLGGSVGEGYLELTSTSTIHSHLGPNISVYARTSSGSWNGVKPVVSMGNLESFVDYGSATFGFAVGNDLALTPATGFSGVTVDATDGLRLFNTELYLYDGADEAVRIRTDDGLEIVPESTYAKPRAITFRNYNDTQDAVDIYATASSTYNSLVVQVRNLSESDSNYLSEVLAPASKDALYRLTVAGDWTGAGEYFIFEIEDTASSSIATLGHTNYPNTLVIDGFSGFVGINTEFPDAALDIGNSGGQIYFSGANGGGGEGILYEDSGSNLRYALHFPGSNVVALSNRASNGVVQIRANTSTAGGGGEVTAVVVEDDEIQLLPSGGNVGVGGTPDSGAILHLMGSGDVTLRIEDTGASEYSILRQEGSDGDFLISRLGTGGTDFIIQPDGDIILAGDSGGKVGIGTDSPNAALTVEVTAANDGLEIWDGNNDYLAARLAYHTTNDNAYLILRASDDTKVSFTAAPNADNYIDNGGSFGIGTDNPNVDLEVASGEPYFRLTSTATGNHSSGDIFSGIDFYTEDSDHGSLPGVHAYIRALHTRSGSGHSFADAGLTFGTTDTSGGVTERMRITHDGLISMGNAAPEGDLHVGAAGGNFMVKVMNAITGSAQTVISSSNPVVYIARIEYIVNESTNTAHGVTSLGLSSNTLLFASGGQSLQLAVDGSGVMTIQRTAGTATFRVVLKIMWI